MNFPALLKSASKWRPAPPRSSPPPRLDSEVRRGVAVGAANSFVLALMAGAPLLVALLAALGGSAVGALIGLLLWSGSDGLPEDPVPPPKDEGI